MGPSPRARGERGVKPSLGADAIVDAVPQLAEVAAIEAQTFRLLPSPEVTIPDLLELADAIEQALEAGYRGIVIELTGDGHAPAWIADRLVDAATRVPVVMASRTGAGEMLRGTYDFKGSEIDLLARRLARRAQGPPAADAAADGRRRRCGDPRDLRRLARPCSGTDSAKLLRSTRIVLISRTNRHSLRSSFREGRRPQT